MRGPKPFGFFFRTIQSRLLIVALFLFFLFSLIIMQFYKLQVIEEGKWKKYAKSQHESIVVEPAKRGVFYSNVSLKKNHPEPEVAFVIDVPKYHLYLDPLMIPSPLKSLVADKIVQLLPSHKLSLEEVKNHCNKQSRFRKVTMWLDKEEKKQLDHWWRPFAKKNKLPSNAIFYIKEYQRSYPYGKLLGQVLHTIREDKDPNTNQVFPTGGLELYFNQYLKGENGKRILEKSLKHKLDTDQLVKMPKDGADIYLTINHHLQTIAEQYLEEGVKKVGAKQGWAVMMDPYSGEIYSLAQYPFFEPMNYKKYYNNEQLLHSTNVKAISDCFEPGSTFKAITMAVALLANQELKRQGKAPIFDPEEMINTQDGSLPGRKPIKDVRFHSFLNMDLALQKSSNIYMTKIVDRMIQALGPHWYQKQLKEVFGIGEPTHIELPYENPGMLPAPGKKYPNGTLQWTVPTPYSLAIGYNVLVNTMQMLRAISVIANGGHLVSPHLVKKIENKQVNSLIYNASQQYKQVLPRTIAQRVVRSMKYVTKPGGAAPLADVYGYTEAGKTSTSEKIEKGTYSKKKHLSSFIGFVPANNPRFILMVCIDEPKVKYIQGFGMTQYGGKCAAPVFREIARNSLEYLGVPYDDPFGFPKGDPRSDSEKADWIKETTQLLNLYKRWNEK